MGLDEIKTASYNDKRKMLSALNKEANRRLYVWKRNTRPNIKPPSTMQYMLQKNLRFKQRNMTNDEVYKQIQEMQKLLSEKTSTVWGARQKLKQYNEYMRDFYDKIDFDETDDERKDDRSRFEHFKDIWTKLWNRVKSNPKVKGFNDLQMSEIQKYSVQLVMHKTYKTVDDYYKDIESQIDVLEKKRAYYDDMLNKARESKWG